ncbi:hypothetical protein BDQ17DRAFT_1437268 [Cyathus striatus]|nr:hypothetical protein BDQ17DRAFT_1437268 [Cyathus striatus]
MSNKSSPQNPTVIVQHPFDGSEGSDIILRTSDNMEFHVYRVILSVASPFFKSMFSLPQPPSDDVSLPIIDVPEHSKALDPLLRYCYPVMDPVISDLTVLVDMLEAAMKYEMIVATTILN